MSKSNRVSLLFIYGGKYDSRRVFKKEQLVKNTNTGTVNKTQITECFGSKGKLEMKNSTLHTAAW